MTYGVELEPSAARALRKLDAAARVRVVTAIKLLADEPRPPAATRLVGASGLWRVRTGAYRIVYEIHDQRLHVLVVAVGHRRDVYRKR